MTSYKATIIDNPADPTFNQLLSINNTGRIGGYFGSGQPGHPNKGYVTNIAGHNFTNENFPGSLQTQVTGLNDAGRAVGFEIDAQGNSIGFLDENGRFALARNPLAPSVNGVVNEQLLGINDSGVAVGFYTTDAAGDTAAFVYHSATNTYVPFNIAGATSVTAAGIDQAGDFCGFFTNSVGAQQGFVELASGHFLVLKGMAGWSGVQALGINDAGKVVGSYIASPGKTEGFTYDIATGAYQSFDYGNGTQTVLNGINDAGTIVGFDVNATGATDGLLLQPPAPQFNFSFTTLDNPADPTFNQLLSINDAGEIAGYFGSGQAGHPNQGYVLINDVAFKLRDFPGSIQTQQTGIDNAGDTVGFEVDAKGNSFGFFEHGASYQRILDPNAPTLNGVVSEQILGLNDKGEMAGFYASDAVGDNAGFVYNQASGKFTNVAIAGAQSVTATGVNDWGWISGFSTDAGGNTLGFIDQGFRTLTIAGDAGDTNIQVLGINNNNLAVGSFVDSAGQTEGFYYQISAHAFHPLDAPAGAMGTVLNGVNDRDQMTGFYTDAASNVHGLLVKPT